MRATDAPSRQQTYPVDDLLVFVEIDERSERVQTDEGDVVLGEEVLTATGLDLVDFAHLILEVRNERPLSQRLAGDFHDQFSGRIALTSLVNVRRQPRS